MYKKLLFLSLLFSAFTVQAQIIEPVDSLLSITFQNFSGSLVILKWNSPAQVTISASSINSITFPGDTTLFISIINSQSQLPIAVSIPLDSIQQISFQSLVTGVTKQGSKIPEQFSVSQNYPNPFNPGTIINYALPKSSLVTIKIYNILGREIRTLVNVEQQAGNYTVQWNGDNNFGRLVASGVYIYRVTAGQNVKTMKMMYLK
ncbi:MAG: T9SS type A sorting domain-containing protein [Ignavibacteriaceae bacterium]